MDQEKGRATGVVRFFREEVVSRHADLLLFTCCLTSGLVDSTIYNGASSPICVTSFQTLTRSSLRHFRFNANW